MVQTMTCPKCGGHMSFADFCGAYVCEDCDYHLGMRCCYCGWNLTREDFAEMVQTEGLDL